MKYEKLRILIPTLPIRQERLDDCLTAIVENSNYPYTLSIYEEDTGGWVGAVRNMLKKEDPDQLCIILGDDCMPKMGWTKILVDKYVEKFPDGNGLAQPDDGIWNGTIATMPCSTPKWLLRWIYSGYKHTCADLEIQKIAVHREEYLFVPESMIVHNNPMVNYDYWDDLYERNQMSARADKNLYDERNNKSHDFVDAWVLDWD